MSGHDDTDLTMNHIEYYVTDLDRARDELVGRLGFTPRGTRQDASARSALLTRGAAVLLVTQAVADHHPAAAFVQLHDDGVADIALRTGNLAAALERATAAGARLVGGPPSPGGHPHATVTGFGDVVHTLVESSGGRTRVPGFAPLGRAEDGSSDRVDHLALCVDAGELEPTVAFYERGFGLRTIFTERIRVGTQAMNSKAVQSRSGGTTLTIIEPDTSADPGQIDGFLKDHNGPGVQHIALGTDDIVATVAEMADRGTVFLAAPGAYYDLVADRISQTRHTIDRLRELNILLDEDNDGQLYQIFTRSTQPRRTFFFEVIERLSARTFGSGNIRALYEAVEYERARTGG